MNPSTPAIIGRDTIASADFLRLERVRYRDRRGQERDWEAVQRNRTPEAAVIIARTRPDDRIVLISQFRPAVGAECLEFPAGLIDPGETAAESAVRELREETGYHGNVVAVCPACASSAGLTGERLIPVLMDIDMNDERNRLPKTDFQDGEDIATWLVPLSGLQSFIEGQLAAGRVPDSRLLFYATAVQSAITAKREETNHD